jgi:hypothetical protein
MKGSCNLIFLVGVVIFSTGFNLEQTWAQNDRQCLIGPSIPGNPDFSEVIPLDPPLEWDEDNPTIIEANSQYELSVIGGVFPFLWQILNEGAFFDADHTADFIITESRQVILFTADLPDCEVQIHVTDSLGQTVTGYLTVKKEPMEWDYTFFNGIIPHGQNHEVQIIDEEDLGPYNWYIEGDNGFSFHPTNNEKQKEAAGKSVTIYAHNYACGPADIRVENSCGITVLGSVRSDGRWDIDNPIFGCLVVKAEGDFSNNDGPEADGRRIKVEGKYKQYHSLKKYGSTTLRSRCDTNPVCPDPDKCLYGYRCDRAFGCTTCLWDDRHIPCINRGGTWGSYCKCTVDGTLFAEEWICD